MGDVSQSKCENSEIYARKRKTTKKKKKKVLLLVYWRQKVLYHSVIALYCREVRKTKC